MLEQEVVPVATVVHHHGRPSMGCRSQGAAYQRHQQAWSSRGESSHQGPDANSRLWASDFCPSPPSHSHHGARVRARGRRKAASAVGPPARRSQPPPQPVATADVRAAATATDAASAAECPQGERGRCWASQQPHQREGCHQAVRSHGGDAPPQICQGSEPWTMATVSTSAKMRDCRRTAGGRCEGGCASASRRWNWQQQGCWPYQRCSPGCAPAEPLAEHFSKPSGPAWSAPTAVSSSRAGFGPPPARTHPRCRRAARQPGDAGRRRRPPRPEAPQGEPAALSALPASLHPNQGALLHHHQRPGQMMTSHHRRRHQGSRCGRGLARHQHASSSPGTHRHFPNRCHRARDPQWPAAHPPWRTRTGPAP
mmetsp:Transcript_103818/g.263661  ORF Transcript_103818/g.263661 Transcript_103818/m.263661 type:complete len:368 (+) Transcript_103818:572-1675(+)